MDKKKSRRSLNTDECGELAKLVEELTHSGQKSLDSSNLKSVTNICKKSDSNLGHVYDLIIHQLEKNHSEIRFSAFQLCNELFRRSHYFRQLVVDKLHHVLELTAETNPDLPLPPPRAAALDLKKLSLTTIRDWCNKYGSGYKKLVLGFNYLQQCKKVDFSALQLQSDAERAREEEKERRLLALNKERVKKVKNELNEFHLDITGTVRSLNSCLSLLLPKPEEFFISFDNDEPNKSDLNDDVAIKRTELKTNNETKKEEGNIESDEECYSSEEIEYEGEDDPDQNTVLREFGAYTAKHTVEINLKLDDVNHLKETSENSAVIENMRDHVKLITNSYLPRVKGWLQILTKASGKADLMKSIMDLKMSMENSLEKYGRLNIEHATDDDCVSTDSEMEEVGENDSLRKCNANKIKESSKRNKKIEDQSAWSILSKEECPEDPTSLQSVLALHSKQNAKAKSSNITEGLKNTQDVKAIASSPKPSTSKEIEIENPQPSTSKENIGEEINERKKKLLAVAPKLPFDVDLYHWEDDDMQAPTLLPTSLDTNKFWSSGDDLMELTVPEGLSRLRTRVIEFVGEFEPVLRSCRAPLPNGKLCPRQDRFKCPFHGKIVPRDEVGKCVNSDDELKIKELEEKKKVPEWQDPELLKDIERSTGINLKMPEKGKKKEKKYPGLTDVKAKQNTAKNRLSKLVFKRSAMKKVARTLDNIDRRRFRDKYGDQFHYMYDTA